MNETVTNNSQMMLASGLENYIWSRHHYISQWCSLVTEHSLANWTGIRYEDQSPVLKISNGEEGSVVLKGTGIAAKIKPRHNTTTAIFKTNTERDFTNINALNLPCSHTVLNFLFLKSPYYNMVKWQKTATDEKISWENYIYSSNTSWNVTFPKSAL